MRFLQPFLATLSMVVFCCLGSFAARADADSSMVIQAVMIRKFVEFVKWPEEAAPQREMRVKVCVYGDSPMSGMNAVFEKTSSNSPIKYTLTTISQMGNVTDLCHVLFIEASKVDQLSVLRGKPLLTISDASGFVERGGMIGFQIIEGKVRYSINNKSFGTAQLKINAQLLEIAYKVVD